jgi:hypothetical protein
MTSAEHIAKLRASVKALDENRPFAIAVKSVHALRVLRIFDKGIDGASYTGGPMYIADNKLRKGGNHTGKTGKPIKTSYYKSYADMKKQQGFTGGQVNLRLTNDLQSDFANSPQTSGTGRPPVGAAIKINPNIYIEALRRPLNQKKLRGHIARYGDFTRFTQEERDAFNKVLTFEFNKLIKNAQ